MKIERQCVLSNKSNMSILTLISEDSGQGLMRSRGGRRRLYCISVGASRQGKHIETIPAVSLFYQRLEALNDLDSYGLERLEGEVTGSKLRLGY